MSTAKLSKGIILVADDEVDIVRAIKLRLNANGYEVVTANDGSEAIHVALSTHPNLMILDIGMPHGDGYTVAQKLLEQGETQSIPIIFLTARTSEVDRTRAYEAGTARYLTKPCVTQVLLDTVERAITCTRPKRAQAMHS